jgi:HK97 family phage prohead protease
MKQQMRVEIKEISPEGYFEGLLSPYGNVDGGGDVVQIGAYDKTMQEHGNKIPLLWQHKTDVPIGELVLDSRPDGLWCKGQLLMALPEAQKAYLLIKARIIKGLSIGFSSLKDSIENGIRILKEIRLYEGSIVTFPMNEMALITTVKKLDGIETKDDFNEELTEIQLQDAGCQMRCALAQALSSVVWSSLTRDEKITATETIIQQFSDAYMAYIPAYLDMLTEMYGGMETWSEKRIETKAGRKISASTKESLKSAHGYMKSASDLLSALLAEEAVGGDDDPADTSKSKAAGEVKTEPVVDHSAAQSLIDSMRSLLQ